MKKRKRKLTGWGGAGKSLHQEIAERREYYESLSDDEFDRRLGEGDRLLAKVEANGESKKVPQPSRAAARMHGLSARGRRKLLAKSARKVA